MYPGLDGVKMAEKFELNPERSTQHQVKQDIEQLSHVVNKLIQEFHDDTHDLVHKLREISDIYGQMKQGAELRNLIKQIRPLLPRMKKITAAIVLKNLFNNLIMASQSSLTAEDFQLCDELLEWSEIEGRRQMQLSLRFSLAQMLHLIGKSNEALKTAEALKLDLQNLDDKPMLMEVLLLASKIYLVCGNYDMAKNNMNDARKLAHVIYPGPCRQAELDMQTGILYTYEGRDYQVAASYFLEAFEQFEQAKAEAKAVVAIRHWILTKIMQKHLEDVFKFKCPPNFLKYVKEESIETLRKLSEELQKQNWTKAKKIMLDFEPYLDFDGIFRRHIDIIYNSLVENEILRIIQPYCKIDLKFMAQKLNLSLDEIESKLAQLILNGKLRGKIEHLQEGITHLVVYEEENNLGYQIVHDIHNSLSEILDALYAKASNLNM